MSEFITPFRNGNPFTSYLRKGATSFSFIFLLFALVYIASQASAKTMYECTSRYPFSMEIPVSWQTISDQELNKLRYEMTEKSNSLYKQYSGLNQESFDSIPFNTGYYSPDGRNKVLISLIRMPPTKEYSKGIASDIKSRVEFGKQQGIISRVVDLSLEPIGHFETVLLDIETQNGTRAITANLYDPEYPYQTISISYFFSANQSSARAEFDHLLKTLKLDFTLKGTTIDGEPFVVSDRCQEHWIVTDVPDSNPKNVVFIFQEPHWDFTGHWNLHQGMKVFFEENPGLSDKTIFLAEGAKSLTAVSVEPLIKSEPAPSEDLIRAILQSYLVTGYMTYDWEVGGKIPIVGTEDWALYQESAQLWLTDKNAPWVVTVAARNRKMVETLSSVRKQYANPMLFVGGMHLHRMKTDLYFEGHSAILPNSPSVGMGNEGIIDLLAEENVQYIYIEPVPSTRSEKMATGTEMLRYKYLFQAQKKGDYKSYLVNSARAIRNLEIYEGHDDGVTVSPSPKAAANLVSSLKKNDGNGGNGDEPAKPQTTNENSSGDENSSPKIGLSDIINKTRDALRDLAGKLGLIPGKKNDPSNHSKPERFYDPVTGKQRLRIDPGHKTKEGIPYDNPNARIPHVHVYTPDDQAIRDKDGEHHFPLVP